MDARQAYLLVSEVISPVYLVGGSVRDTLMRRPSYDFDFATPLDPDAVEGRIRAAGKRPYLVGKRFGTVGMRIDGHAMEITTLRSESYVDHSRKPHVEFHAELGHDLARRDFTINAMAMDGDALIDPFGGQPDIIARVVRAVGNPSDRFREDPLRMLRAARFASQLDFSIDSETVDAMRVLAPRILLVARERWMLELDRLLVGPAAAYALRVMADTGLLGYVLPEVALQLGTARDGSALATASGGDGGSEGSLFEHTLGALSAAPSEPTARWAALLHDVAVPFLRASSVGNGVGVREPDGRDARNLLGGEIVERLALYLKWSNQRRDDVKALVVGDAP